jgi:hypothetical protein
MAETMHPEGWASPSEKPRPGVVTFAAFMLFLLGGFQLMFAILEFMRATWVAINVAGTFGGPLWLWGIIDVLFALIAIAAGADLLRGGTFGRVVGIVIAACSAFRWFFYIPAQPWVAVVVIAVDVVILYGLAVHGDYFRSAPTAT